MSADLFTQKELKAYLRQKVSEAGGAKKWLRKNNLTHESYILHMVSNGDAATLPGFMEALGFRAVMRYEPIAQNTETK